MPASRTGVWHATVTRLSAQGPYVEIPRTVRGAEYGPCAILEGLWTATTVTPAAVADHGQHSHDLPNPLAAGDRVLVAFLQGRPDVPVVLGRLT